MSETAQNTLTTETQDWCLLFFRKKTDRTPALKFFRNGLTRAEAEAEIQAELANRPTPYERTELLDAAEGLRRLRLA